MTPQEPPMIEQILGTPESAMKWLVVAIGGLAAWEFIKSKLRK